MVIKFTLLDGFQCPAIAELHQDTPQLATEIDSARLAILRRRVMTADEIVPHDNVTRVSFLACAKLNIIPFEGQQFPKPQTGSQGGQKERVSLGPVHSCGIKKSGCFLTGEAVNPSLAPLCGVEATEANGWILVDDAVLNSMAEERS